MRKRFFDFEVYPNWWCCCFGDLPEGEIHDNNKDTFIDESIKETFFCVDSDMPDARDRLMAALKEADWVQCGYNIKGYDLMISNAIYQAFDPQEIRAISDIIVKPELMYSTKTHLRLAPFAKKRMNGLTYLDLFDSSTGSLKDKEAILGLSVVETSVPFDKENLTEEDKEDIKKYCFHDVFSAMWWYVQIVHPFINAKLALCKKFNLPEKNAYNLTNAGLVALALRVKRMSYIDEDRVDIELPKQIRQYCYDNLPSNVLTHVLNSKSLLKVTMFENEVVYADGGIHSTYILPAFKKDSPVLYVSSDDEWILVNVDASSFYPGIMVHLGTLSRAIPNPEEFNAIMQERFAIKWKKNKTKDDDDLQLADKLILNTTYGASGCKWLELYDPYNRTRTCRYGQLLLTALANKMYKTIPGLKVVQTNTDGVLVYVRRKDLPMLKKLEDEWTSHTNIPLEEDYVEKIWQKDVNNYLLVKQGGKKKVKGAWLNHTIIRPGYIMISPRTAFVSGKAVCDYLMYGKDIIKTIVEERDPMNLVITCTKGPTYHSVVQRMADGSEVPLYKCNRIIPTKDTNYGRLYKVKGYGLNKSYTQMPSTPEHCLCLNDSMKNHPFEELQPKIDYMYYIQKCADQLDGPWFQLNGSGLKTTDQFKYFD